MRTTKSLSWAQTAWEREGSSMVAPSIEIGGRTSGRTEYRTCILRTGWRLTFPIQIGRLAALTIRFLGLRAEPDRPPPRLTETRRTGENDSSAEHCRCLGCQRISARPPQGRQPRFAAATRRSEVLRLRISRFKARLLRIPQKASVNSHLRSTFSTYTSGLPQIPIVLATSRTQIKEEN